MSLTAYADWKAPADEGRILLWPTWTQLVRQTQGNHSAMGAATACLQHVPLRRLRAAAREELGHGPADRPLIATGHQTELYHPGVWVKQVLVHVLAEHLQGSAFHFAIDTDAPKHLQLRWPQYSAPITDDPQLSSAPWCGLLQSPTAAHLEVLSQDLAQAKWPFVPLAGDFLGDCRELLPRQPLLGGLLTAALAKLDQQLGLHRQNVLGSAQWLSLPYLVFLHHILARAGEFAGIYNQALADYRREHKLHGAVRPWPNLQVAADAIEVPFWRDTRGARGRATVQRRGGQWVLSADDDQAFVLQPGADGWQAAENLRQFLQTARMTLCPRALTLTMYLRLLVVDQFVHGIGGGRYDQVTDQVIQQFAGLAAPGFSVTTATLYFPTAHALRRPDLALLQLRGRRLRHGWACAGKREMAQRIASLPRRSPDRRQFFGHMHQQLAQALQHQRYLQWQRDWEQARQSQADQLPLFDRELFYGIQPAERLQHLIQQYRQLSAGLSCGSPNRS